MSGAPNDDAFEQLAERVLAKLQQDLLDGHIRWPEYQAEVEALERWRHYARATSCDTGDDE